MMLNYTFHVMFWVDVHHDWNNWVFCLPRPAHDVNQLLTVCLLKIITHRHYTIFFLVKWKNLIASVLVWTDANNLLVYLLTRELLLPLQICLVLASVVAVIIYRVIARVDLFQSRGEAGQLIASVTSTFLNTVSIMIMGKVSRFQIHFLQCWRHWGSVHFQQFPGVACLTSPITSCFFRSDLWCMSIINQFHESFQNRYHLEIVWYSCGKFYCLPFSPFWYVNIPCEQGLS